MQMSKRKKQCLHSLCKRQNAKNSACIAYANAKPLRNVFAGTLQAMKR